MGREDRQRISDSTRTMSTRPSSPAPTTQARACAPRPLPPPPLGPRIDQAGWRGVLDLVRMDRPALAAVLARAAVMRFDLERVVLGYKATSLLLGVAGEASARDRLSTALAAHFGRVPSLAFEAIPGKVPDAPKPSRCPPRGPRR